MSARSGISRRQALQMTAALGGLAMVSSVNSALSQVAPRIEQLAPALEKILSPSQTIEHLADGFGGPLGPAEGPLWWKEGGYLLFSDIHNNKRMKYEPAKASRCSWSRPTGRTG